MEKRVSFLIFSFPPFLPVFLLLPFLPTTTLLSSTSPTSHLPHSVSLDAFFPSSPAHLSKRSWRAGGKEGVEHPGPSDPKLNEQHIKELTVILTELPEGRKLFSFINAVTNQPINSEGIKLNPYWATKAKHKTLPNDLDPAHFPHSAH